MSRPTYAVLSKHALEHNIKMIRHHAPQAQLMVMVKANAYGHGLRSVSLRIESLVDGFGVASMDEAAILRSVGITKSIHVMQGILHEDEAIQCLSLECTPVISRLEQLKWLQDVIEARDAPYFIWLKAQTGLNRLGFDDDLEHAIEIIEKKNTFSWGLMTHWSCADNVDHPYHKKQYERVKALVEKYPHVIKTINSSMGIVTLPEFNYGWVRSGAAVYGISTPQLPLLPVMELRSAVILIRDAQPGEASGYGALHPFTEKTRIAVITIGYGDGYPRNIAQGAYVLIRGKQCVIVGTISMDMLVVNVSHVVDIQIGDNVILWGKDLPVDDVARYASTISYELVSGICFRVNFHWDDKAYCSENS